MSGGF